MLSEVQLIKQVNVIRFQRENAAVFINNLGLRAAKVECQNLRRMLY